MEFLFSKFQAYKLQPSALHVSKIPENSRDNVVLWNPFLQKQVRTGSLQNSCSEQLSEKLTSVLKKVSNMDVLLRSFQNFSKWFFDFSKMLMDRFF